MEVAIKGPQAFPAKLAEFKNPKGSAPPAFGKDGKNHGKNGCNDRRLQHTDCGKAEDALAEVHGRLEDCRRQADKHNHSSQLVQASEAVD